MGKHGGGPSEPVSEPPGEPASDEDIREMEAGRADWDMPQTRATMEMLRRAEAAGKTLNEVQWSEVADLADIWPELSTLWWKDEEEKAAYFAEQQRRQVTQPRKPEEPQA